MSSLAERWRHARELRGLSARDLSARMGFSHSLAGQVERGLIAHPRARVLIKAAEVLDVDLTWLLTGEGEPPAVEGDE